MVSVDTLYYNCIWTGFAQLRRSQQHSKQGHNMKLHMTLGLIFLVLNSLLFSLPNNLDREDLGIRDFESNLHEADVRRIGTQAMPQLIPGFWLMQNPVEREILRAAFDSRNDPHQHFKIIEFQGKALGFVHYSLHSPLWRRVYWINRSNRGADTKISRGRISTGNGAWQPPDARNNA